MSTEIIQQPQTELKDVFNGIGCFYGTFSLEVKPDSKPYQGTPRHISYTLQKPFKQKFEHLQQQDIITLLGMDETVEWCNSFVLVAKPNRKVRSCLDPVQVNYTLIRLVHRKSTLNDIFPKLNNVQ